LPSRSKVIEKLLLHSKHKFSYILAQLGIMQAVPFSFNLNSPEQLSKFSSSKHLNKLPFERESYKYLQKGKETSSIHVYIFSSLKTD